MSLNILQKAQVNYHASRDNILDCARSTIEGTFRSVMDGFLRRVFNFVEDFSLLSIVSSGLLTHINFTFIITESRSEEMTVTTTSTLHCVSTYIFNFHGLDRVKHLDLLFDSLISNLHLSGMNGFSALLRTTDHETGSQN